MNSALNLYMNMFNLERSLNENIKSFLIFSFSLLIITFMVFALQGCAQKPKTIIKYKYIEKPCPKLQTLPLNQLNLNSDKELKFNFKVKNK